MSKNEYKKKLKLPTTERVCLRCQKAFKSIGPANRICDACNTLNVAVPKLGYVAQPNRQQRKGSDHR